ncbi:hypothetical protein ANRL4_05209 [Anaerolineae bacterium]|nr:hypothetical protein ANRL4_05209 [Anaerolineae bacterium]
MIKRILSSIVHTANRFLQFWVNDVRQRRGCFGKSLSIAIGLIVILFVCSCPVMVLQSAGEALGVLPTRTASPIPTRKLEPTVTAQPKASATLKPTDTPAPTNTPKPSNTAEPTATVVEASPTSTKRPTLRSTALIVSTAPAGAVIPTAAELPTAQPTVAVVSTQVPPTQPAAGIELISLTSPASQNSNAAITIRTAPGANCNITVIYKSGPSTADGLEPVTAGGDGVASWTWKVGGRTTPGTWSIVISCQPGGRATFPFVVQ